MSAPRTAPAQYQLVETRLQQRLDQGRTRCHLCPWRCTLRHGQRGFCQAHVNRHGTLYNLSYGIISAIDVGPIEAKPVRHFRPGTSLTYGETAAMVTRATPRPLVPSAEWLMIPVQVFLFAYTANV